MYLIYIGLGAVLMVVIYQARKPVGKILHTIKNKFKKPSQSDIKRLEEQLNDLSDFVKDLNTEFQLLKEVNGETQRNNTLLFPERFDQDKTDGKTIFVKDGEEKPYDTINWRSR